MLNYKIYETMKPKERFLASLDRKKVDRATVGNPTSIATIESMEECDAYFPDVHLDSMKMAKLAATGFELLEFDTISPYFSVQQEAAAFGCNINWGSKDTMPDTRGNPYEDPEEIKIPSNLLDHEALDTVIQAIRVLNKEYGKHVCIIGKVMGPFTLSYHLYGVQRFLMDTIENPEKVHKFLNKLKEVTVLFATAQFSAGADVVTLADHATGDLVGPYVYDKFLLSVHQEITSRVRGPFILHICGKTTDRMHHISRANFKAFHFDSKNDLIEAKNIASENNLLLTGNINNPDALYGGNPDIVKQEVYKALDAGIRIISPECAIPLATPNENLRAIVDGVREYCFKQ